MKYYVVVVGLKNPDRMRVSFCKANSSRDLEDDLDSIVGKGNYSLECGSDMPGMPVVGDPGMEFLYNLLNHDANFTKPGTLADRLSDALYRTFFLGVLYNDNQRKLASQIVGLLTASESQTNDEIPDAEDKTEDEEKPGSPKPPKKGDAN